jgi:hypothetical protein
VQTPSPRSAAAATGTSGTHPPASAVLAAERPRSQKAAFTVALVLGGLVLVLPILLGCRSTAAVDCPDSHLSVEEGLKPDARRVLRCVHAAFPEIKTFYGKREDPLPDHPSGRAVDIMIDSAFSDYRGAAGVDLGNRVVSYLQAHKDELRIDYLIWRQRSWKANRADADWHSMKDRGSDNANHFNHVHVTTLGVGEQPAGKEPTRVEKPPPAGEGTATSTESPGDSLTINPRPEVASAYLVDAGTDTQLTQICLGTQFQVVADLVSTEKLASVTLALSGAVTSGPSPMEGDTGTAYRSATIALDTPGTSLFTLVATAESGVSIESQATLTVPSADECGQVEAFETS